MRSAKLDPRQIRRILLLAIVGALALLAGPFVAKSEAGVYSASECAWWRGHSEAQYSEAGHHFQIITRDCTGGGMGMALPQAYWSAYGSEARFQLWAPPGTHFSQVSFLQRGTNADGWNQDVIACGGSICANAGPTADGVWHGIAVPSGHYTHWIARLICLNANCYGSSQAGLFIRDVTMSMSDDVVPTVAQSGELLASEVQRGSGNLDIAPLDVGAGLTESWVLVNERVVARQAYTCFGRPMQPCPSGEGTLSINLDTQASPFHDGDNSVQSCAADFGIPPNVGCSAERIVRVDNSCTESNVPGGSDLSAFFPRSSKDTVAVKAGQGARLAGRLTDRSGNPVANASLCVKEGVAGRALEAVGTLKTNSEGRYRYGVSPGPNRRLQVGYRYNRRQLERQASFFSKLRPRLKLSPARKTRNRKRLTMYGSIPGPSNDGRVVILQAQYPDSNRWNTFAKARTDEHGRYSSRYRFTSTYATTRYRMRAWVPAQKGYPYRGGASRPRPIIVVGR
jgi:hypothetical protein